jgi:L-ascorbate metabolism protein UlaG (beta-lactamase superfamily)
MLSGKPLIDDIDRAEVPFGGYAFWWLGQHSFIVKLGKKILYLDAFLSPLPNRVVPPMLKPEEIRHADFFFGSHDHADHIDRAVWPGLARASAKAKFIVPELLRKNLSQELKISEDRFIGLDDQRTVEIDGIKITGIAAAHEFLDCDSATGQYPYLGYVIEGNGCALYHSGDCCIYEGLATKLRRWNFDVVFLPINGRDARRLSQNCIGNMTYQEAADLAGVLAPKLTIPAHYDMFAMNMENPDLFIDYMKVKYPTIKTYLCEYGTKLQSSIR